MTDAHRTIARYWLLPLVLLMGCSPGLPETELVRAARRGDAQAIGTLLESGLNPDQRTGQNDWTPLMHAIHKNQKEAVTALLEGGADGNIQNDRGLTALIMAAGYGSHDIVDQLLSHGSDPHLQTEDGDNALSNAVAGVTDIDRFTLGSCQADTVAALLEQAPGLRLGDTSAGRSSRWIAWLGGCSGVLKMIER